MRTITPTTAIVATVSLLSALVGACLIEADGLEGPGGTGAGGVKGTSASGASIVNPGCDDQNPCTKDGYDPSVHMCTHTVELNPQWAVSDPCITDSCDGTVQEHKFNDYARCALQGGADGFCDPGTKGCAPLLALGTPCDAGGQCGKDGQGHCVDGVCCESSCDQPCFRCGGDAGACSPIMSGGTDDKPDCSGTQVCNGGGECKTANWYACSVDKDCASVRCRGYCNLQPARVCGVNSPCAMGDTCVGMQCVP